MIRSPRLLAATMFLLGVALLPASACRRAAMETDALVKVDTMLHLLAFDCSAGGAHLAVYDLERDVVELYTPDGRRTLAHQMAASGAKYGDGQYVLWTKGKDIRFELDGLEIPGCAVTGRQTVLEAAWRAGYRFRASGNEPDWVLLAGPNRIQVLSDQGRSPANFPGLTAGELDAPGVLRRRTEAHTLEVTVRAERCADSMSGEPSPAAVEVVLDGRMLSGCGLWLR